MYLYEVTLAKPSSTVISYTAVPIDITPAPAVVNFPAPNWAALGPNPTIAVDELVRVMGIGYRDHSLLRGWCSGDQEGEPEVMDLLQCYTRAYTTHTCCHCSIGHIKPVHVQQEIYSK